MRCSKHKTLIVLTGCTVWLAVLGWVDRATGYELGLFAFYTAPVGVVAWNLGRGPGIIAAFIASVIWYIADRYAGDRYTAPFYGYLYYGVRRRVIPPAKPRGFSIGARRASGCGYDFT